MRHIYTCACTCTHIHTHTRTHACMHARTHTHTHTRNIIYDSKPSMTLYHCSGIYYNSLYIYIYIYMWEFRGKQSLNRDIGQELPPVMLQLVSHDVSHVTWPWNSVWWRRVWETAKIYTKKEVSWEVKHLLINTERRNWIITFEYVYVLPLDSRNICHIIYMDTGKNNSVYNPLVTPQTASGDLTSGWKKWTKHITTNNDFYVLPSHSQYGDRMFSVAGPRLWHSLPVVMKKTCCLMIFIRLENPPIPGCVWSVDTCQFI